MNQENNQSIKQSAQATEQQPTPQPADQPQSFLSKLNWKYVGVGLAVVLVVGVGAFWVGRKTDTNPNIYPVPTQNIINTPTEENTYQCLKDSDCIKVSNNCCGCNAGGQEVAINIEYQTSWQQKLNCEAQITLKNYSCTNAYFCTENQPKCINSKCTLISPTPNQPLNLTLTPKAISNWQTYKNTKYNFEFQYPQELAINGDYQVEIRSSISTSGNLLKSKPNSRFIVVVGHSWGVSMYADGDDAFKKCSSDKECYDLYFEEINKSPRSNLKEINATILGKNVRGFEFTKENLLVKYYPMSKDGKFFLITFSFVSYSMDEISDMQSTIDQILLSLKFTD